MIDSTTLTPLHDDHDVRNIDGKTEKIDMAQLSRKKPLFEKSNFNHAVAGQGAEFDGSYTYMGASRGESAAESSNHLKNHIPDPDDVCGFF